MASAGQNKRRDPEPDFARAGIANPDRIDQHAYPPRLRHHLGQRRLARVIPPVGDDQQRLFIIAAMRDHDQSIDERVEKAHRKISSRELRSSMNCAIAVRACGILGSMLPELSTMIPTDTGVLKSRRKNSMLRWTSSI